MSKSLTIAIACSPGGHMTQARQLECVYKKYNYFYFTFNGKVANELRKTNSVISIPNIVRHNPLSWIWGILASIFWAIKTRPQIVICTGAGITVFFCVFAKLFGAKLIFLESMAKVEKPTLTARMLYPFSDLFLVQWPGLLKFFPKAKYEGRLF